MVLEVDMDPLAIGTPCLVDGYLHQPGTNSRAASLRRYKGVEDECMAGTVPRDVEESHKYSCVTSADPTETVLVHLPPPVVVQYGVLEAFGVQQVHFDAVELATP